MYDYRTFFALPDIAISPYFASGLKGHVFTSPTYYITFFISLSFF